MPADINPNIKLEYDLLTILDKKASALLTSNSIFLAVLTGRFNDLIADIPRSISTTITVLLLISCLLLFTAIYLRWTKHDKIEGKDVKKRTEDLENIRRRRTIAYQTAWFMSAGSILVLICFSLLQFDLDVFGSN
ncbi:MAG: hypothetical protein AAF672_14260 [Pseudomonadota bacterium]